MRSLLALPRVALLAGPTPLVPAPALSAELGTEVWFKRDDLTGFGLGGNKARTLEYLLGDALERGCDCLVTGAGPQSNWAALAALAARRCGLDPYLIYYGPPRPASGNLVLNEITGADVRFTGELARESVDSGIAALAAELERAGRRPCVLPRGGATPLGAAGYVRASAELAGQLLAAGLAPASLWLATGSCGTQAGLLAGARWLGVPYAVTGVTVSRPAAECRQRVAELALAAAGLLGLSGPGPAVGPDSPDSDVLVVGGHLGPGYGKRSAAGEVAARLVAAAEGVFLDPVFGAKAMAALIGAARGGNLAGPVVFLVTGGAPALFAGEKVPT